MREPARSAPAARSETAFTLIELLIVVAIIAILAAIAVPNFLEAQTRAKVSRAKSDMRSLATAIESFAIDHNAYPPARAFTDLNELGSITTPVAYMTSVPVDAFKIVKISGGLAYEYVLFKFHPEEPLADDSCANPAVGGNAPSMCVRMEAPLDLQTIHYSWMLLSVGPDTDEEYNYAGDCPRCLFNKTYDPTNGTVSNGEIFKVQNNGRLY